MLPINVYHGGQILNTSTDTGYNIHDACTFSADETINLRDLKRQIHAGLELLSRQFNISIRAQINTAQAGPRCLNRVLNSVQSPAIFKYTQTL
jgi:hypothetical protein